jgi:hypothetical protein
MDDATGLAEALLGLDGFAVLAVDETPSEVIVTVETPTHPRVIPWFCAARNSQATVALMEVSSRWRDRKCSFSPTTKEKCAT